MARQTGLLALRDGTGIADAFEMNNWAIAVGRLEFLRRAARYGMLSALAGVAVWNMRSRTRWFGGANCVNRGLCGGCPAFVDCGLPPAMSVRQRTSGG